jgi:hypothetical protein
MQKFLGSAAFSTPYFLWPGDYHTCYRTFPFFPIHAEGYLIQTDSGDINQIRARLRKMSDLELRKFGRSARGYGRPKEELRSTESGL